MSVVNVPNCWPLDVGIRYFCFVEHQLIRETSSLGTCSEVPILKSRPKMNKNMFLMPKGQRRILQCSATRREIVRFEHQGTNPYKS